MLNAFLTNLSYFETMSKFDLMLVKTSIFLVFCFILVLIIFIKTRDAGVLVLLIPAITLFMWTKYNVDSINKWEANALEQVKKIVVNE